MQRQLGMDAIRIALTALVVFHHTAIVYGGSGGWYWREEADASHLGLVVFNCINQSFFMGFFFLLAGYFSTASLQHKTPADFLQERLLRLGLPTLFYFFVLSPLTIALALRTGNESLLQLFWHLIKEGRFGPGPLWFAAALLIMSTVYLGVYHSLNAHLPRIQKLPGFWALLALMLALGMCSFAIRLWIPVGKEVLWMQVGYFAPYIFLFTAGCLSYRSRLLENICLQQCLPWFALSLLSLFMLTCMLIFRLQQGGFHGGWNLNAFFYALWDPLFSTGVILGMLWGCQQYFSRNNPPFSRAVPFLARRAYAVYILHAPVLVALSRSAAEWQTEPVLKFIGLGTLTCGMCVVLASLLLKVPKLGRVI